MATEVSQDFKEARVQITENEVIEINNFSSDFAGMTNIKLDMLNVNVPYDSKDIEVEYIKTNKSTTAIIFDKETREEIDRYTEEIDDIQPMADNLIYRTLIRSKQIFPADVEVCTRVAIWSSGSFRQIDEVLDVWQRAGSGGWYTLEDTHTFSNTRLPATRIQVNASGNVTTSKSLALEYRS